MIDFIRDKTKASIRRICGVLGLPRSSYYQAAKPTTTQMEDREIGRQIEIIFHQHRRRYGYRRIHDDLQDLGIACAPSRVRRLMKERGLRAIAPKNYVPRTSDGRADKPSSNLLFERESPSCINEVWIGDITFIPTSKGWRYLAVVIDLYSRRVVGWSLASHLRSELVCDALAKALLSRPRSGPLVFHSDRGSQYGSNAFRSLLKEAKITQSMSRRANPYDNAWTESFVGTLKTEMLQGGRFIDEKDAHTEIFAYIEGYYNTQRKHSALGYLPPSKFESHYLQN
jgi:transposase InsO family protein